MTTDDDFERWLKRHRDANPPDSNAWHALNDALDDYREHLHTGTPLDQPAAGPHELDGDCAEGLIDYHKRTDTWSLRCSGVSHGCLGTAPGTAVGHDSLVRLWAEHDQTEHEGDGKVPGWMFINRPAGAR